MKSKYFFEQCGDAIANDVKEYEAHQEKRNTDKARCDHSLAKVVQNKLRCACGAAWFGPGIERLLNHLKTSP